MNLGIKLVSAREKLGLTMDVVSEATKIGKSSLSEFENNKREPSLSQLDSLAAFYNLPVSYFMSEELALAEPAGILWRNAPAEEEKKKVESEFKELTRQYYSLELWTQHRSMDSFRKLFIDEVIFTDAQVRKLANTVRVLMGLGDYPAKSLESVLEEVFDVRIFSWGFGEKPAAACFYHEVWGPAILLSRDVTPWRRNFDIAHELFHLISWKVRLLMLERIDTREEERLANYFAACLLMPTEKVRDAVESSRDENGQVSLDKLVQIAALFDVSHDTFFWRLHEIFGVPQEAIKTAINEAREQADQRRMYSPPAYYPKRYVALAETALRNGEISVGRYLKLLSHEKPTRAAAEKLLGFGKVEALDVPASLA